MIEARKSRWTTSRLLKSFLSDERTKKASSEFLETTLSILKGRRRMQREAFEELSVKEDVRRRDKFVDEKV